MTMNNQVFTCRVKQRNKLVEWKATLQVISDVSPYEAIVEARGSSLHIIFGPYMNGNYLSLPIWHVGTELASYDDEFWNRESMERCGLSGYEARTLARAIHLMSDSLQ